MEEDYDRHGFGSQDPGFAPEEWARLASEFWKLETLSSEMRLYGFRRRIAGTGLDQSLLAPFQENDVLREARALLSVSFNFVHS